MYISANQHTKLRQRIDEVSVLDAYALIKDQGVILLDVRSASEVAKGYAEGALCCGRDFIEYDMEKITTDLAQPILTMCAAGGRSMFAVATLIALGFNDVRSVAGGFGDWKAHNLPVITPSIDAPSPYRSYL